MHKINYSKYEASNLSWNEDPNYQKAISQKRTSRIFLWSAVGIWVADLGYTWIRVSNTQRLLSGAALDNISLAGSWDNANQSQSISLIYTF